MNRISLVSMDPLAFYSKHGIMTDPGKHACLLAGLPDDLVSLCSVVQNNLIHVFWAERMGVNLTEGQRSTLQIRSVSGKLANMVETNDQPLSIPRPLVSVKLGTAVTSPSF